MSANTTTCSHGLIAIASLEHLREAPRSGPSSQDSIRGWSLNTKPLQHPERDLKPRLIRPLF